VEDVDFPRKELAKFAACSADGGMEIAVEKQTFQISAESVWFHMDDTMQQGCTSRK